MAWSAGQINFFRTEADEALKLWAQRRRAEVRFGIKPEDFEAKSYRVDNEVTKATYVDEFCDLVNAYCADAMNVRLAVEEFTESLPTFPDANRNALMGLEILERTRAAIRRLLRDDEYMDSLLKDSQGPDVDLSAAKDTPDPQKVAQDSLKDTEKGKPKDKEIRDTAFGKDANKMDDEVRKEFFEDAANKGEEPKKEEGPQEPPPPEERKRRRNEEDESCEGAKHPEQESRERPAPKSPMPKKKKDDAPNFVDLDSRNTFIEATKWLGCLMTRVGTGFEDFTLFHARGGYTPQMPRLEPLIENGLKTQRELSGLITQINTAIRRLKPPAMDKRPRDDADDE